MKAAGQEIVVHEVDLDSAEALGEEAFLSTGEGSFFVSRVFELVFIKPTTGGVAQLPAKVEQLVARGLHHAVVSLEGVGDLEGDSLRVLMQVKEILDRCVGSLRLCDVDSDVQHKLQTLGITDSLKIFSDRDEAVDDYKASAGEGDEVGGREAAAEDPDDWGWGSADEVVEDEGPPRVPVAELLIEDTELPKLLKQITQIRLRSEKRYVSLRMHFDRQITSEDVTVLTSCRDYLASEGGQLALVALQTDVGKWLRLLEFDREFVLAESADEADMAHRLHAAGEAVAPPTKVAPAVVEVPAPSGATPSVEFESNISLAIEGGVPTNAELIALQSKLAQAQSEAAQLRAQVSQLRDGLKRAEEAESHANRRNKEFSESLRRDERRLRELEQARERAEERTKSMEAESASKRTESERLEAEVRSLRQQLDSARAGAAESGEASLRLQELEQENQALRDEIKRLEAGGSSEGDEDAQALHARFQEEKARILSEAEEEIRRLSEEQDMLREELQSAGEMIERLGKELELS